MLEKLSTGFAVCLVVAAIVLAFVPRPTQTQPEVPEDLAINEPTGYMYVDSNGIATFDPVGRELLSEHHGGIYEIRYVPKDRIRIVIAHGVDNPALIGASPGS